MLGLLLLKHAKHHNLNTGFVSSNESTKKYHKAERLLEIRGSHQQTHDASNRISPSIRQRNKTGWLIGNYKL